MTNARAPDDVQRPLAVATLLVTLGVMVPVLAEAKAIRGVVLAAWGVSLATFATCALAALVARARVAKLALLVVAAAAVVSVVLLACDGFEGALLVLVALQLGGLLPRRRALAWVIAQSIVIGAAIAWHWSAQPALLLAPPYCGFGILAVFLADVLASSAAARRALAAANLELLAAQHLAADHSRLTERVRIARDLHDAVGHRLTALAMHLDVARKLATGEAADEVGVAHALARDALDDVRAVVERLRDDERLDVASALRTLADDTLVPQVHVSAPDAIRRLEPARALSLLRCAQEIVTNARRHSAAANLWLTVDLEGGALDLVARDDGVGCAALRAGHGLRGMRERVEAAGGRLAITTGEGRGFALHATFPASTT